MGRPLKKNYYQDPLVEGYQFDEVDAWIPGEGGAEKCYITRQAGTYKFVCHSKSGEAEGLCRLVDKTPVNLLEGEMMMTCTPFGGSSTKIHSMTQNKVRTYTGEQFVWDKDEPATGMGQADIDNIIIESAAPLEGFSTTFTIGSIDAGGGDFYYGVYVGFFGALGEAVWDDLLGSEAVFEEIIGAAINETRIRVTFPNSDNPFTEHRLLFYINDVLETTLQTSSGASSEQIYTYVSGTAFFDLFPPLVGQTVNIRFVAEVL